VEKLELPKEQEIAPQDRKMYKKFNYKLFNKMQKILVINKPPTSLLEEEKRKSEFNKNPSHSIISTNDHQTLDYSSYRSQKLRPSLGKKHAKSNDFTNFRPASTGRQFKTSGELFLKEKEEGKEQKQEEEESTEVEKINNSDTNILQNKKKIYSMEECFWDRVLTTDLRDNSEISDFLFDKKNMVSLKNFMELSKQGQPKNPKIYFNHKIYREFNEDYKPKVLTTRKC